MTCILFHFISLRDLLCKMSLMMEVISTFYEYEMIQDQWTYLGISSTILLLLMPYSFFIIILETEHEQERWAEREREYLK